MYPYVSGANSLCVCHTTPTPHIFGAKPYIWRSRVKNERHDLIGNPPYCLLYNSYEFSLEYLVLDQLIIP